MEVGPMAGRGSPAILVGPQSHDDRTQARTEVLDSRAILTAFQIRETAIISFHPLRVILDRIALILRLPLRALPGRPRPGMNKNLGNHQTNSWRAFTPVVHCRIQGQDCTEEQTLLKETMG